MVVQGGKLCLPMLSSWLEVPDSLFSHLYKCLFSGHLYILSVAMNKYHNQGIIDSIPPELN